MKTNIKLLIGRKIKEARERKKLSLRDYASQTEVGFSWLAKVEKGQINFQIDSLLLLMDQLDIPLTEIFTVKK